MSPAIKQFMGIYLPAHEEHLIGWMERRMASHPQERDSSGRANYQMHKQAAAMRLVKKFDVAVDVGAHVGLWSMNLARDFGLVHAFEPVALHRECFLMNVPGTNVVLHPHAVGRQPMIVRMHTTKGSSGDSWVDPTGEGEDVPMVTIDSLNLPGLDFIKLDTEGFELLALQGAEETLLKFKPCVCVEQKPNRAPKYGLGERDAVVYLQGLGAKLRQEISGDFLLSWD
jgi:FkbM family methyltransferase